MVVKCVAWDQVGGLDEVNLPIAFNDVDFSLRLREWLGGESFGLRTLRCSTTSRSVEGPMLRARVQPDFRRELGLYAEAMGSPRPAQ